jgi:hypothetical protein
MVTARSATDDIVKGLSTGANDYVTKPIDFDVLEARIQSHLWLRRAFEAMNRSNEFYRAIVSNATEVVMQLTRALTVVYASPASWRLLGRSSEELVGTDFLDLIPQPARKMVAAQLGQMRAESVSFRMTHPIKMAANLVTNATTQPRPASTTRAPGSASAAPCASTSSGRVAQRRSFTAQVIGDRAARTAGALALRFFAPEEAGPVHLVRLEPFVREHVRRIERADVGEEPVHDLGDLSLLRVVLDLAARMERVAVDLDADLLLRLANGRVGERLPWLHETLRDRVGREPARSRRMAQEEPTAP